MNESYVIRKERCPRCAEQGKDTSSDNLVVYSDGHSFCYGYTFLDNFIVQLK